MLLKKLFLLLTSFIFITTAQSECLPNTYYIDFEQGNDNNSGTCSEEAWKHAPGDSNAQGIAGSYTPTGGDIVKFKGDVVYQGKFDIAFSGGLNNPIIYDGDSWPGLEGVQAILDGSIPINGTWTQCQSAAECGGNPNYANIYHIDLPSPQTFEKGFYEEGEFLWYAQDPNPSDPFNFDNFYEYRVIPISDTTIHHTPTSINDPRFFTQSDPNYYDSSYVAVWHIPNIVSVLKITSYDPNTNTIYHEPLPFGNNVYTDRDTYYSVLNHLAYLDSPGEYVVNETSQRLYAWANDSNQPDNISVLDLNAAAMMHGQNNIVIEGFQVRSFSGGIHAVNDSSNIIIRNNHIKNLKSNDWYTISINGTNITVENNNLKDCHRSVGILSAGTDLMIKDNIVERTSRQGIWLMSNTHANVIGNKVININGAHASGISIYLYNKDILIADNEVLGSPSSITWHGNNDRNHTVNLVLYNNIFETRASSFDYDMRGVILLNNIFLGGLSNGPDADSVLINNIVGYGGEGTIARIHNIYTGLQWNQAPQYGWDLNEGEIDCSNCNIGDIINNNYEPVEGSIIIDAGIDVSSYFPSSTFPLYNFGNDKQGIQRPYGNGWDIGPYEFTGVILATLTPTIAIPTHTPIFPTSTPLIPTNTPIPTLPLITPTPLDIPVILEIEAKSGVTILIEFK